LIEERNTQNMFVWRAMM